MISNKRGDTQTLWMVVGLVVILLVSVTLIAGYSIGWGNFATWIRQDTLKSASTQCATFCVMEDKTNYCENPVNFKAGGFNIDETDFSRKIAAAEKEFLDSLNQESVVSAERVYSDYYDSYVLVNRFENQVYGNLSVYNMNSAETELVKAAKTYLDSQVVSVGSTEKPAYSSEDIQKIDTASEAAKILSNAMYLGGITFDNSGKLTNYPSGTIPGTFVKDKSILPNKKAGSAYVSYLSAISNFRSKAKMEPEEFELILQKYVLFKNYEKINQGFSGKKILGLINIKIGTVEDEYTCRELSDHPVWGDLFDPCPAVQRFCGEESLFALLQKANPENYLA